MVAVAILAVALVASLTVILNSMHLENQTEELNTAKNAAELQLQQLRGLTFPQLLDLVNTQGNGSFFQGSFEVLGLRSQAGDADGRCGWFEVRKRPGVVNENLIDLTVRVEWLGSRGGNQDFQMVSMRSDRGQRWTPPGN
jgi:hypothetical protein